MKNISAKDRGFTIVELLVVIVVIGILAAITIVSYSGVTSKANKASAQSAANNLASKIEVYFADGPTSSYPITFAALNEEGSTTTYYTTGVSYAGMGSVITSNYGVGTNPATATMPSDPSGVLYVVCGTGATTDAPANRTAITKITGYKVYYWDYTTSLITTTPLTGGITDGSVATYGVACAPTGS